MRPFLAESCCVAHPYFSVGVASSVELRMKHAMNAVTTISALTGCSGQNWFSLRSVVSVTYCHCVLIASSVFGVLALSELP